MTDPLPQNRQAEEAVLGAVLMNPPVYYSIAGMPSDVFYIHRNRWIWEAFDILVKRNTPIDMLTVSNVLGEKGQLEEVGGPAYLTSLISSVPSSMNAEAYADTVAKMAALRHLIRAGTEMAQAAYEQKDPAEIITQTLPKIAVGAIRHGRAEHISTESVLDLFLERVANPKEIWGIRSGFAVLDSTLGGIHPGEVFVLAGSPGVGKTTLACQIGFQMAGLQFWPGQRGDNVPGAIYEMEMSANAVIRRTACALSRVGWSSVMKGDLKAEDQAAFLDALGSINDAPVYISDATHWSSAFLRADVARLVSERGIKWMVLDYAGLLKDSAASAYDREVAVSKAMSDLAKDCGVAVILVETLNKPGMDGNVSLSAMMGAGQKSYDADVVAFMNMNSGRTTWSTEDPLPGDRYVVLRKAREANKEKAPLALWHNGDTKLLLPASSMPTPGGML